MHAAPAVTAILIPFDERPEVLERVTASLGEQSLPPAQIVVVDQSPDGRFAHLSQIAGVDVHDFLELKHSIGACLIDQFDEPRDASQVGSVVGDD